MSVFLPPSITRHADAESAKRLAPYFRGGFSLVEMVVSLAVVSVLLAGMTSAVVLASRALPTNDGPAAARVESARVLHQLRDDLRAATELLNRTATSVTINLPDRDGDGRPEMVTYAWAGTAGDPLTRSVNGGTPATTLDNLHSFALTYTTADRDTVFPGAVTTSSEQLLSSFSTSDISGTLDHPLSGSNWIGTNVHPALPASAASWQITRALFYGSISGAAESTVTFELRGSSGGFPTTAVLDSTTLAETNMSVRNWYQATFNSPTFAASDPASIVLANHGGGDAGTWSYYTHHTPPSAMLRSNNGGSTWLSPGTTEELQHFVYGTYQFTGDDWTFTQPRVAAVGVTLVYGRAAETSQQLTVTLPNTPDAADGLWEADFNADPTTLDLAQRAGSDWIYAGGFPAGDLADGRWALTGGLESEPRNGDLDQPAIVRAVMADTSDDATHGGFELRVELDGNNEGGVVRAVVGLAGGQQTLLVSGYNGTTGGFDIWLDKAYNADEKVDLKLYINPAEDNIGVVVNGEVCGSFVYDVAGVNNVSALVAIAGSATSGVRLDHLRMTRGGTTAITPGAY